MTPSIFPCLPLCVACLIAPFAGAQEAPAEISNTNLLPVQGADVRALFNDDKAASGVVPTGRERERRLPLRVRLETWEAPAMEVAKRLDELGGEDGLVAMRARCLAGTEGVRLVHSPVISADASTRMATLSLSERIYPTEYEPPELACGHKSPDGLLPTKTLPEWMEQLMTSATPTSYETRDTGTKLTVLAQAVAVEEKSWDLAVLFEDVGHTGKESFGHESLHVTMPVMSSFSTGGMIRLKEGKWRLLSVMEPPRGLDGKSSEKRWVTLVRIDPEG